MRPLLSFLLIQCLGILSYTNSNGQSHYFRQYTADDGLAHNSVSAIIQDKNGLMWIGTRDGLNRFDGYSFKSYKNKGSKFGNIGNNVVITLVEDKNGMLWIGTGNGIFRYDPHNEIYTPLANAPQAYIKDIVVDQKNNLFFLNNDVLYQYNQKENQLTNLKIHASSLAVYNEQFILLGNDDGELLFYNVNSKVVLRKRIIDLKTPANLRSISKIFPIKNDQILIGCFKQGLKCYNTKTGSISSLSLTNTNNTDIYVRDISLGYDQEYWIATESGIYIYNILTKSCINLKKRAGDPYALADNAVYTICKDNQGGMWVGTFFGGLNYYSKKNARFEKYYPQPGINSISGNAVREICADWNGDLWIGTEDAGLNKLETKTGKFTNYTAKGRKGDLSYPNIHGLLAFGKELYVGPFLHGLETIDIKTGLVTNRIRNIGEKNEVSNDFVLCIYLTRDSTILVGTGYNKGSGLFVFDKTRKKFTRIKEVPTGTYVYDVSEDSKGNIWAGSLANGTYYYNPKTKKSGNIRFGNKVNGKIIDEFPVYGIMEDSNKSIWFTTEGGGLIRLTEDGKTQKKFTIENGLPSNALFRTLEDDSGRLWISSLKGLVCFDLKTEQFKTYTKSNGLITDQFNFSSAYKDKNGKIFFGSVKGMIAFDPKEFGQKDPAPSTFITGFQINNKELVPDENGSPLKKSITYSDSIVLEHNQNNFSIEFAALNYASPEDTRYEYTMHGLDKNSTYLNNNRNAYFTDLSPGEYTFMVRAKSNVGSWTGQQRLLYIHILPPFWKSTIAYLFYFIFSIVALYFSVRYYHRYLENKNSNRLRLFEHQKEKEIYQAKIEFFTNIAHEIQTPLTLILGPIERMIKKAEENPTIKKSLLLVEKNAKRLGELTTQLLDFRKTEMHQFGLNFVNTDINNLLKEQVSVFATQAEKEDIKFDLDFPKTHVIAFADKEALMKIFSNLISNALKYSTSNCKITLSYDEKHIVIRFANDGRAIPKQFTEHIFEPFFRLYRKDKPGTGIGLSLARSLTELHHGSLKLISGELNNIIFEMILPIHQEFEFKLNSWKKLK